MPFAGLNPQRLFPGERWSSAGHEDRIDAVAEETPVALVYDGVPHVVMMASPQDLEDFALGFGLTEGLLERADELYGVEVQPDPAGMRVEMEVSSACFARLKDKRRSMAGRTGCGLCGTESLEQVEPPLRALAPGAPLLSPAATAAGDSSAPVPRTPRPGARSTARCASCARTSAAITRSTSSSARWSRPVSTRATASAASPAAPAWRWCARPWPPASRP